MRVNGFEVFAVANPTPSIGGPVWMFVRIDTDTGTSGYGEIFTSSVYSRPLTLVRVIEGMVEDFVLGRPVEEIESLYQRVYNSHYTHIADLTKLAVLSGIEVALWDALGKSLGRPVHALLGGRIRRSVRLYSYLSPPPDGPSGAAFWSDPEAVGRRAAQLVDEGFTGLKLDPFPLLTGGDSLAGQFVPVQPTGELLDHTEALLAAIRSAVGSRADLMLGTHGQFTTSGAVRVARRIERFDPLWFEEPVPPELAEEMALVARSTTVPIAAGERLASKAEFARLVRHDAASIFNFDVSQVGGLLEAKKISALAEATFRQVTPHVFGGPLVAAASLQLALTLPNLLIMEGNGRYDGVYAELLDEPLHWERGYLWPTDRPGMGHDLNEELARELAVTADHEFQYARPATEH
ncbi:mandelate racemase/muconate lactonizing enzyme family protein [Rugosimonospora africana]|uniref:Isomerase n=1 Tax=Rugosimonospora africana TaxID=556532 RepID=A0A8J3VSG5_9ACTN|nr:mandelate racemase/muconate lactonizing enzyme family protein [Rugosimonospora africana]GIH16571.1 isomerase [Rugosimonospora africana]